jgi:hypothetical protein
MLSDKLIQRYLTPRQVELIYSIPVGTQANLRSQGRGPKYYLIGDTPGKRRKILYCIDDIESWIRRNPVITIDSLTEH